MSDDSVGRGRIAERHGAPSSLSWGHGQVTAHDRSVNFDLAVDVPADLVTASLVPRCADGPLLARLRASILQRATEIWTSITSLAASPGTDVDPM